MPAPDGSRTLAGLTLLAAALTTGACSTLPRRLTYHEVPSPAMDRVMEYAVYAPPDHAPGEALPLVVFLHGGGDEPDCFDRAGMGQRLDAALAAGRVPRVVIVVPQGDLGMWANWHDGTRRYEDWVLKDLLPRVAERYHTAPCPDGCHVMGNSMGGFGALRLVLHNPGLFGSVTSLSGPVLDTARMLELSNSWLMNTVLRLDRIFGPPEDRASVEREDLFLRWTSPADLRGTRLLLAWGEEDREALIASNRAFHDHLDRHGIPHRTRVYAGRHAWRDWAGVIEEALRDPVGTGP